MRTKRQKSERKAARARPRRKKFYPTRAMQAFLEAALDPDVRTTIAATARAAGVDRRNWWFWKRDEAFSRWFQNKWREGSRGLEWILDKIGIEKGRKDFRYWDAMQRKYGGEGQGLGGSGFYVVVRAPRPNYRAGCRVSGAE